MNSVSLVPWKAQQQHSTDLDLPSPTLTKFVSNSLLSPDKIVLTGNIVAVKTVIKNI